MHNQSWIYYGQVKQHLIQLSFNNINNDMAIRLNGVIVFHEKLLPEKKSQEFALFIDEELCQIFAERQDSGAYLFKLITPEFSTSKTGKKRKFKDRLEKFGLGSVFFIIFAALCSIGLYFTYHSYLKRQTLTKGGLLTMAKVYKIDPPIQINNKETKKKEFFSIVSYTFHFGDKRYAGTQKVKLDDRKAPLKSAIGLPIRNGFEFEALFASENPEVSEIRFDRPSENQINHYFFLAREACQQNFKPELEKDLTNHVLFCDCYNKYIQLNYGLKGFADLYFQNIIQTGKNEWTYTIDTTLIESKLRSEINRICDEVIDKGLEAY